MCKLLVSLKTVIMPWFLGNEFKIYTILGFKLIQTQSNMLWMTYE